MLLVNVCMSGVKVSSSWYLFSRHFGLKCFVSCGGKCNVLVVSDKFAKSAN